MLLEIFATLALASGSADAPPAATASIEAMLRRPQYEQVKISPDGSALAIAYRQEGGTLVTVVRRSDRSLIAQIDPGSRGEVSALAWLGSHQLIIAANRSTGPYASPIVEPALYLLDLHAKHPRVLPANFIGTIEGDDSHLLVGECNRFDEKGNCMYEVQRVDTARPSSDGEVLTRLPLADAQVMADHAGSVRFAWAWDDTGHSRLFVHAADGQWNKLNDSQDSHVDVVPLGVSRDNRTAFLQSEQREGPDIIESYDLTSGERHRLLDDAVSDPLGIIRSLDGREPIGAWFGPGRPFARYWNPASEDAKWHRALAGAFPGSSASVVSASADGNELVIRTSSDRDDGSYYLLDRATGKVQLLFHVRPWLDPGRMVPVQSFSILARDGLPLHGFVAMPAGQPTHAPMVVVVHGGPYLIRDGWRFDEETQLLAAHGYAVLHVNFRGSGGFGRAFVERGYRQWGAAMQDDVTDATQWAIASGLADPQRICIYGASYGGYAALMGVAREPKLYRCAIGLAGVYDLDRMYRWGDIHRSDYGMHYLKTVLGEDKAVLASRSPSALAARISVPVLLAHGELDGRVSVKHAREMRRALKKTGQPVEYVTYDWEGHGLAKPEDRLDFYTRLLRFLDANLAPADTAASH